MVINIESATLHLSVFTCRKSRKIAWLRLQLLRKFEKRKFYRNWKNLKRLFSISCSLLVGESIKMLDLLWLLVIVGLVNESSFHVQVTSEAKNLMIFWLLKHFTRWWKSQVVLIDNHFFSLKVSWSSCCTIAGSNFLEGRGGWIVTPVYWWTQLSHCTESWKTLKQRTICIKRCLL